MFKGKKESYSFSVCRPFVDTRISTTAELFTNLWLDSLYSVSLLVDSLTASYHYKPTLWMLSSFYYFLKVQKTLTSKSFSSFDMST